MTIGEFWGALIRSWRLGAAVLVACTAVGVIAGVLARPAYEATAVFQVEQLADIGGSVSWDTPHSVRPRLNVDVLEKWLGGADALDRIVALAGAQAQVTPAVLHRDLLVIPAGDVGLYEVTARSASPDLARRIADAAAVVLADRAARFVALEQDVLVVARRCVQPRPCPVLRSEDDRCEGNRQESRKTKRAGKHVLHAEESSGRRRCAAIISCRFPSRLSAPYLRPSAGHGSRFEMCHNGWQCRGKWLGSCCLGFR